MNDKMDCSFSFIWFTLAREIDVYWPRKFLKNIVFMIILLTFRHRCFPICVLPPSVCRLCLNDRV
jgi:hypothetical protein